MPILFVLFVIIPLIEIVVLINVGQMIGAWYTIGLVLLSAFIGVNLLRYQGLSTLFRARQRMNSGEIPAKEMIEGIILAVGGALLITPGFVTDFLGFCCLIPFSRWLLVSKLQKYFTVVNLRGGGPHASGPGFEEPGSPFDDARDPRRGADRDPSGRRGDTIEGDYRRDD